MRCTLGTLASGTSATVLLTVQPSVNGAQINEAQVTADQADPVVTNNVVALTANTVSFTCANPCFSGPTLFAAGPGDLSPFQIEKGDFNEDGRVDLVASPATDSTISVLFGDGAGGFGPPMALTTLNAPQSVGRRRLQQRRACRHRLGLRDWQHGLDLPR